MSTQQKNGDELLQAITETAPVVEAFPTDREPERLPRRQYCVFRAGRERFCFSVLDIDEVVEWPKVTQIPLAPPFLMGIFNLRGVIIPVIDIGLTEARRPDLPPKHVVVACLREKAGRAISAWVSRAMRCLAPLPPPNRCWWTRLHAMSPTAAACCVTGRAWHWHWI